MGNEHGTCVGKNKEKGTAKVKDSFTEYNKYAVPYNTRSISERPKISREEVVQTLSNLKSSKK